MYAEHPTSPPRHYMSEKETGEQSTVKYVFYNRKNIYLLFKIVKVTEFKLNFPTLEITLG